MNKPIKVTRRAFVYVGLGTIAIIAAGTAVYYATLPPKVEQKVVEKPVEKTVVQTQVQTATQTVEKPIEKTVVTTVAGTPTTVVQTQVATVEKLVEKTVTVTAEAARAAKPKYGGNLKVLDIRTLIPNLDFGRFLSGEYRLPEFNHKLVDFDNDGIIVPELAEKWETPDGGKTWTFFLRKDVKWHDGHKFTSADVKWNFDRLIVNKFKKTFYETLTKAEAVDDHTVKLHLSAPSNFVSVLATDRGGMLLPKLPQEVINPKGNDPWGTEYFSKNLVGTGPFRLITHKPNEYQKWVRFDEYFEKDEWGNRLPYLDSVEIFVQGDNVARYNTMKAGGFEVLVDADTKFWKTEQDSKDFTLVIHPSTNYTHIYFNMANKDSPYADIRVRRAVAHAINRQEMIELVADGYGEPAYMFFSKKNPFYHKPIEQMMPEFNLEKAKTLMAQAGYPNGFEDTFEARNEGKLIASAKAMQAQLARIGIRAKINATDSAAHVAILNSKKWATNVGTSGDKTDMVIMFLGSQFRNSFYHEVNKEADTLTKQLSETADPAKLKEIITRLQIMLVTDLPQIALYNDKSAYMHRKAVKGLYVRLAHDTAAVGTPSYKKAWFE